jgi:hypothetical protein
VKSRIVVEEKHESDRLPVKITDRRLCGPVASEERFTRSIGMSRARTPVTSASVARLR